MKKHVIEGNKNEFCFSLRVHGLWRKTTFPLVPAVSYKRSYSVDLEVRGTKYITYIKISYCLACLQIKSTVLSLILSTNGKENFKIVFKMEEIHEYFHQSI